MHLTILVSHENTVFLSYATTQIITTTVQWFFFYPGEIAPVPF